MERERECAVTHTHTHIAPFINIFFFTIVLLYHMFHSKGLVDRLAFVFPQYRKTVFRIRDPFSLDIDFKRMYIDSEMIWMYFDSKDHFWI